jgi:hypothetical protein
MGDWLHCISTTGFAVRRPMPMNDSAAGFAPLLECG